MKKKQPYALVNELLKLLISDSEHTIQNPLRNGEFLIDRSNVREFYRILRDLHDCIPEIANAISLNVFESHVIKFISPFIKQKTLINHKCFDKFKHGLIGEGLKQFDVFADIVGLDLWNKDHPIILGPYTILNYEKHSLNLFAIVGSESKLFSSSPPLPKDLIHIKISAYDNATAEEFAEEKFSQFGKIISYMLNNRKYGSGIRISSRQQADVRRIYTSSGSARSVNNTRVDGITVPITDPYFVASEFGHDYIWEIISKSNVTDMQVRIIAAVEWLGEAMLDDTSSSTLLKSAIALEALLGMDRSAITNTLSESAAQILTNSVDNRIYVAKKIKHLYSVRSGVVHGRSTTTHEFDAQEFLDYCAECVSRFLVVPKLKSIQTDDDLKDFFSSMRYSGPSIE